MRPIEYLAMADTLDNLPVLVQKTRKSRGLSLRDLSESTGINIASLSRFENGKHTLIARHNSALLRWLAT